MSYDLFFFELKDGETARTINDFLEAEEAKKEDEDEVEGSDPDEDEDEVDDEDEDEDDDFDDDDDEPLIPVRFIGNKLSDDQLRLVLKKAYLSAFLSENKRNEEMARFLETDDPEAWEEDWGSEEWQIELDDFFEYSSHGGMVPLMFSFKNVEGIHKSLAKMVKNLATQPIAVYDPQIDRVIDSTNIDELVKDGGASEDE